MMLRRRRRGCHRRERKSVVEGVILRYIRHTSHSTKHSMFEWDIRTLKRSAAPCTLYAKRYPLYATNEIDDQDIHAQHPKSASAETIPRL